MSFHCNTYTQNFKENFNGENRIAHICTHQMANWIPLLCYKTSKLQIFTHTKTYLVTKPSNHKVTPNWTLLNSKSQSFTSNNNPHKNEKWKPQNHKTSSQWTPQLTPNLNDLKFGCKNVFHALLNCFLKFQHCLLHVNSCVATLTTKPRSNLNPQLMNELVQIVDMWT